MGNITIDEIIIKASYFNNSVLSIKYKGPLPYQSKASDK